ncbi:MAG: tetratricopeptide (TPR) repeat protein, partial [Myxococcota bacterium]
RMSTATDVRADRAATKQEPDFDEPTDVNKKSPLDGPRVRRKTGQFAIGDASAPDEETAHNLDPMDDDDTVLGATKRSGPPLLLIALAALVVVSILFVAWRLATKPSVEEAPPAAAAAPSLTESEKTMVAFGEGIAAHEAGRFEDAESRFTDLIKSGNQPKGVLAGLASAYFQQGKFEDARNLLDDLSRSQPDDPRIWAYLGAVYSKLGKHDEARTALERAVDVSDDGPLKQQLEAALGAEPKP